MTLKYGINNIDVICDMTDPFKDFQGMGRGGGGGGGAGLGGGAAGLAGRGGAQSVPKPASPVADPAGDGGAAAAAAPASPDGDGDGDSDEFFEGEVDGYTLPEGLWQRMRGPNGIYYVETTTGEIFTPPKKKNFARQGLDGFVHYASAANKKVGEAFEGIKSTMTSNASDGGKKLAKQILALMALSGTIFTLYKKYRATRPETEPEDDSDVTTGSAAGGSSGGSGGSAGSAGSTTDDYAAYRKEIDEKLKKFAT